LPCPPPRRNIDVQCRFCAAPLTGANARLMADFSERRILRLDESQPPRRSRLAGKTHTTSTIRPGRSGRTAARVSAGVRKIGRCLLAVVRRPLHSCTDAPASHVYQNAGLFPSSIRPAATKSEPYERGFRSNNSSNRHFPAMPRTPNPSPEPRSEGHEAKRSRIIDDRTALPSEAD